MGFHALTRPTALPHAGARGNGLHGSHASVTISAMSIAQPIRRFTPQEYYRLERAADCKSDYYDGEIFNMSGGTSRHSLI